jgi:hypothetical protein
MNQRPTVSAVGANLDERVEIAALAHRYYEEEGRLDGRDREHWLRAEQEVRIRNSVPPPGPKPSPLTAKDRVTEQEMLLAQ